MKVLTILFLLGLLFESLAFFGAQAENIPSILNFILPKYKNALIGLKIFDLKETLIPQEKGFKELHGIILIEESTQYTVSSKFILKKGV